MIRKSFIFLEKISTKKEQNIWNQGINDWQDFLNTMKIKGIAKKKLAYYKHRIQEVQHHLHNNDSSYFTFLLPQKEMWRLYDYFRDESCYLDIETDSYGKIIIVGISDYYSTKTFVKKINLDPKEIEKEISRFKIIITFNGSSFDLPRLKKQYNIEINIPHIDLKPLCIKLGLTGGLKEVEKQLNLKRPPHLYGNPVQLWKAFHASGDKEYLDLLIDYNKEDIENLKLIMDYCYKELSNKIYKQKQQPNSHAPKSTKKN